MSLVKLDKMDQQNSLHGVGTTWTCKAAITVENVAEVFQPSQVPTPEISSHLYYKITCFTQK